MHVSNHTLIETAFKDPFQLSIAYPSVCNRITGGEEEGTFGPHGNDDVDCERLVVLDGTTHSQRNLQRYQFGADVSVFALVPLSTAAQEVLHSPRAHQSPSVCIPKTVGT